MTRRENVNASENVPVRPSETQYNRYNMTLPQSFSVYNDEGSVIYRGEVEQVANQLRAELLGYGQGVKEEPIVEPVVTVRGYTKKRGFFLVLSLLLAAVVVAIAVVGLFKLSFNGHISLFHHQYAKTTSIVLLDPLFSFLKKSFKVKLGAMPTDFAMYMKPVKNGEIGMAIAHYALPVAIVLYVVFAIIMLFVSIAGLAGKKSANGTYRKARLGFLSIVMFVCALIIAIAGIYVTGGKIADVVSFITGGEDGISAGYGYYAILAIPVVTFICTCLAYGKGEVQQ